jgi:hypothetical protein
VLPEPITDPGSASFVTTQAASTVPTERKLLDAIQTCTRFEARPQPFDELGVNGSSNTGHL